MLYMMVFQRYLLGRALKNFINKISDTVLSNKDSCLHNLRAEIKKSPGTKQI